MNRKISLFQKVCFGILLIPTLFLLAIICFTLLYGKQITEGAVRTVGNNVFKPLIVPTVAIMNIVAYSDKMGLETAKTDFKEGKLRVYAFGELLKYENEYRILLAENQIELFHVNQNEMEINWIAGYNEFMKQQIAEKYGINFLDSLKQKSIENSASMR